MPSCIIEGCPNKKGKTAQEGVILHSFPTSLDKIIRWLEATGQKFEEIEAVAEKILEGKDNDLFRLCSSHFTPECYKTNTKRKTLMKASLPTIFTIPKSKVLINEDSILSFSRKRRKTEQKSKVCGTVKCSFDVSPKPSTSDASTQTESEDLDDSSLSYPVVPKKEDPDYNPLDASIPDSEYSHVPFTGETLDQETFETSDDYISKIVAMRKFIVFEKCLDELVRKVRCLSSASCLKKIHTISKQFKGSAVIIRAVCEDGHRFKVFESQPKVKHRYAGNVLLSSSLDFAGLDYKGFSNFSKIFGLRIIGETTYYSYRKKYVFPALELAWQKEKKHVKEQITGKPITMGGDGQCYSPGHNVKYCVYNMMDLVSGRIIDFEAVQSTQCTPSSAMEKYAFETCMRRLMDEGIDVFVFASNHHASIRKLMSTKFSHILHQFDACHYAKSICKKIRELSSKKEFSCLTPWIEKISNHFWWSIKNCNNNEVTLQDNWLAVLHHVLNVHDWIDDDGVRHACKHRPLTDTEIETSIWLHKDTSAYKQLKIIIEDKKLLSDLKHLVWSCHTGPLKAFHKTVLKYGTKRIHFGIDSIEARTILAVLANNNNVQRPQAVVKKENKKTRNVGSKRFKPTEPKGENKWAVNNLLEGRQFEFLLPILEDTLKICEGSLTYSWIPRSSSVPSNISKVLRPHLEELMSQRHNRFGISQ